MIKKTIYIFYLFLISLANVQSQDPQYSQFYAAPTSINPAFAGTGNSSRFILNSRLQWPSIPGAYKSVHFSYDQNLTKLNSGLGILINHDQAGSGALRFTNLAAQYSYLLEVHRDIFVRAGMQMGMSGRNIDFNKLTFGDQLIRGNGFQTVEPFAPKDVKYFDMAAGVLFYMKDIWASISLHHINEPNQALLQDNSILPKKFALTAGKKFNFDQQQNYQTISRSLTVAFHYKAQGNNDQFDIGTYYEIYPFTFGAWYRGLPGIKQYYDTQLNHDALILLSGLQIDNFKLGYSYDITVSKIFSNTGGSHEISMIYEFLNERSRFAKRRRNVPCPKF